MVIKYSYFLSIIESANGLSSYSRPTEFVWCTWWEQIIARNLILKTSATMTHFYFLPKSSPFQRVIHFGKRFWHFRWSHRCPGIRPFVLKFLENSCSKRMSSGKPMKLSVASWNPSARRCSWTTERRVIFLHCWSIYFHILLSTIWYRILQKVIARTFNNFEFSSRMYFIVLTRAFYRIDLNRCRVFNALFIVRCYTKYLIEHTNETELLAHFGPPTGNNFLCIIP